MKKTLLTFLAFLCGTNVVFGQETAEAVVLADEIISETPQLQLSEQLPFQQVISYAIEVSSIALSEKKPVGRYYCDTIYSIDGYNELPKYPCELIVHSKKGPIVVRYQNISSEMDDEIKTFLSENQMETSLYYNNGRFRFSVDEEDEEE